MKIEWIFCRQCNKELGLYQAGCEYCRPLRPRLYLQESDKGVGDKMEYSYLLYPSKSVYKFLAFRMCLEDLVKYAINYHYQTYYDEQDEFPEEMEFWEGTDFLGRFRVAIRPRTLFLVKAESITPAT